MVSAGGIIYFVKVLIITYSRNIYLPAYNLSGNLIITNNKSMKESKKPHWTYIKFSSPTTEPGQSVKLSVFLYYLPSHY